MEIYVTPEIKRLIREKINRLETEIRHLHENNSQFNTSNEIWFKIIIPKIRKLESDKITIDNFLIIEKIPIDEFRTYVGSNIDNILFNPSPEFKKNVILSCYRLRNTLSSYSTESEEDGNTLSPSSTESEKEICGICLETLNNDICIVPCNSSHIFHCNCINQAPQQLQLDRCPMCRDPINVDNKIELISTKPNACTRRIDYIITILFNKIPYLKKIPLLIFINFILNNAVLYYIYKLCLTCWDKVLILNLKLNNEQWESKAAEIKKEANAATDANNVNIRLARMITTMEREAEAVVARMNVNRKSVAVAFITELATSRAAKAREAARTNWRARLRAVEEGRERAGQSKTLSGKSKTTGDKIRIGGRKRKSNKKKRKTNKKRKSQKKQIKKEEEATKDKVV